MLCATGAARRAFVLRAGPITSSPGMKHRPADVTKCHTLDEDFAGQALIETATARMSVLAVAGRHHFSGKSLPLPLSQQLFRVTGALTNVIGHRSGAQLFVNLDCIDLLTLGPEGIGAAEQTLADRQPVRLRRGW